MQSLTTRHEVRRVLVVTLDTQISLVAFGKIVVGVMSGALANYGRRFSFADGWYIQYCWIDCESLSVQTTR